MITPLDIENKKFSKQMMNGYNVEEVDDFLDELIPVKYYLEVSSPGLDRKFKTEKEYIKVANNISQFVVFALSI